MANYTGVAFETQLRLMEATAPLAQLATSSAEMWQAAKGELTKSATSLQQNLRPLEDAWQDQAGQACQARGRQSCADIDSWTQKIDGVVADLTGLATLITTTADEFAKLKARLAEAANAAQLVELLLQLQQAGGALLNTLAKEFLRVTGTLTGAQGSPWSGPGGSSGGGSAGTGGPTGNPAGGGQTASASAGGGTGPSAASAASASGEGASASAMEGNGAIPPDLAGDPTLQGMGTSTPPQAALPSMPPPAVAPTGQSVAPIIPPVGLTGGRAGGGVPGVRLGGGLRSIPQAAAPVPTEAGNTGSGQKPPASPGQATPSHGVPRGGLGAVPPMSPMMGGLGAGGAGARPGPGTAQPTASGRGAKPTSTPGLPASLRGRADRTDRAAFAPLSRPARREEPVADDAVQLLDEEMWQVDQAPAEIRGERPGPKRATGR